MNTGKKCMVVMKTGSITSMHVQYYVLDINDYDLMENPEQVEGIS